MNPRAVLAVALSGLALGAALHLLGKPSQANLAWAAGVVAVLLPTALDVGRALRRGRIGVDLIALLAMVGSLVLGEFLAGAIIALMLSGGAELEAYASRRARRELSALLRRAPRVAHRRAVAGLEDIPVAEVAPGDVLLVKPGEVVPVDGVALAGAVLDESALTGEARPVEVETGALVRSGGTAGSAFEIRASLPAAQSTYAGIVRLVEEATRAKAPFVRLADRYALVFLAVTLALAGGAWAWSGEPVRALAVLVVATPCPLILAAPAALVSGVSRAARHGVVMKGAGPLERLARADVVLLDKTGTLTAGRPRLVATQAGAGVSPEELLRLAASVEQASVHPYAPAIVDEARARGLALAFPQDVEESPGSGVAGTVDGGRVAVGRWAFVASGAAASADLRPLEERAELEGSSLVHVGLNGRHLGALLLQDPIRPEAPRVLRALRREGIRRIEMVTGDHPDVAAIVGEALGVDRIYADRSPADKVDVVLEARRSGTVAMVGDGINDAPALAQADVGIAMGARGATAASEAADVVLTGERLEGLVAALRISRRTRRIALQSVLVGMGLSMAAMLFAAAGLIPPVAGAILQEGIDVLVILNALRALGGRPVVARPSDQTRRLARELEVAHAALRPRLDELATIAAQLDDLGSAEARARLLQVREGLERELLPHEHGEQMEAFPVVARLSSPEDPTGPLVRTHQEIQRLARIYGKLVDATSAEGITREQRRDIQRILYALHAILTMHFAQEEEAYAVLQA